jgi:hypothetical protein
MRCLLVALIFISLWALFSELRAESSTACPVTTQVESTAIARAWHDDVINREIRPSSAILSVLKSCITRPAVIPRS